MKKAISFTICALIVIGLSAGIIFVPYASGLCTAVLSVLFCVICVESGWGKSITLTLLSLLTVFGTKFTAGIGAESAVASISAFCMATLSGAVMGWLIKGNAAFHMVLTGGALANLTSFLSEFGLLKFYHSLDLGEELINKPIAEFFTIYNDVLLKSGAENAEAIVEMMGEVQWAMQQMLSAITPSMLIIFCALYGYAVFLISRKILFKKAGIMLSYPAFSKLKLPKYMSIILGALFIITFFTGASSLSGAITNIVIILCAVYVVCGLSVADFFFKRKANIHWLLRAVIYIAAFIFLSVLGMIFPFANITTVLLFIGVFDSISDFRRLRSHES